MAKIKVSIKWAAVVLAAALSTQAKGATLVESLNNTVADGAITINNSRTAWDSLTGYVTDPNEGSNLDWNQITIANDSTNLYVRYLFNANTAGGLNGNILFFLDTDQDRSTGSTGGGGQLSIGAEYMIEGATIYAFTGSFQTEWSWVSVGGVSYDTSIATDLIFSLSGATIGSPQTFDFLVLGQGAISSTAYNDYYLDNSNLGASGEYFAYATVPEPTTTALLLGGLGIAGVRTLRRLRR